MAAAGVTAEDLAARVESDPKTVRRWLNEDRLPHVATRARVAQEFGREQSYLWPALLRREPAGASVGVPELVHLWGARSQVPADLWATTLAQARERIEVLVYAAAFLIDTHRLPDHVQRLSAAGGSARILLGDPDAPLLAQRGVDEGLPNVPARAASAQEYLAGVRGLPGVQLRLHATPLYVSLVRGDDTLLVNLHTHGVPAKDSPVMQLVKVPDGRLFPYYEAAFERVWQLGRDVP